MLKNLIVFTAIFLNFQLTNAQYSKLGKETKEKILNAKLVELDNIGHLPHIEDLDRFIQPFIKFLEE